MIRPTLDPETAGSSKPSLEKECASIDDAPRAEGFHFEMWLWMLCAATAVCGVWLRLDGLTRHPLWADEVATLARIRFDSLSGVMTDATKSPFPPLYYVLLWIWTRFCGTTDVAVRAFSALVSVATLPALVVVWRPLLSARALAWALALTSLNAWQVWYSQDAKMYSLVFLLSLISGGLFARILQAPNGSRGIVWMLAGVNGVLLSTSYVGVVVPVTQGLYALSVFVWRSDLRARLLEVAGASLVGLTPLVLWLPYALDAATSRRGIGWIPDVSCWDAPAELYALAILFWAGIRPPWSVPDSIWTASLLVVHAPPILMSVLALRSFRRQARVSNGQVQLKNSRTAISQRDVHRYLSWWVIAPVLGSLVFSLTIYSLWGVPRFLMTVCPAWLIGTAIVVAESKSGQLGAATGVVLLIANLLSLGFDRTHITRAPWQETAIAIEHVGAAQAGDVGTGLAHPFLRVFAQQPREFSWEPMQHALTVHAPRVDVRLGELSTDTPVEHDETFIVIDYRSDSIEESFHDQFPAHYVRPLHSAAVYEDPLTAMPALFRPRSFLLWVVVPRDRGFSDHSALRIQPVE